jgi:hypothetical protein
MKLSRFIRWTVLLGSIGLNSAQAQAPARTQIAGNVTAVDSDKQQISLQTDKGETVTLSASEKTVIVHIPPGETDVKKGTKMAFSELAAGDRVVAFARPSDDPKMLQATSLVVRTKADVASVQQKQQEDWKKRGAAGIVTEVDAAGQSLTIRAGQRTWKVQASDKTQFHRYSPDSARPADARKSSFAEVKSGDQANVLGNRGEDGTIAAEVVYSGSFRQIAATVISVDPATNEMQVTDLATKKPLTIRITPESTLKKLPEQMAQGLARRYQGGRGGSGEAPAPAAGGGRGRGGDVGSMLERLPSVPLSELKPKDAIMVSTTQGSDPGKVTAITLLAGVEPILTAAPTATRDIMSGWNLGAGSEGNQ